MSFRPHSVSSVYMRSYPSSNVCEYLAVSYYLEGKGSQVKGIHDEAQLVPRLIQKVLQPLVPQALHIRPHHPYGRAGSPHHHIHIYNIFK